MPKFTLKADITFLADTIDDALLQLSKHFKALYDSDEGSLEFFGTLECKKEDT